MITSPFAKAIETTLIAQIHQLEADLTSARDRLDRIRANAPNTCELAGYHVFVLGANVCSSCHKPRAECGTLPIRYPRPL